MLSATCSSMAGCISPCDLAMVAFFFKSPNLNMFPARFSTEELLSFLLVVMKGGSDENSPNKPQRKTKKKKK